MFKWLGRLVGDSNEKVLRKIKPIVEKINSLEPQFQQLSDEALRAKTDEFRRRFQELTAEEIADLDKDYATKNRRDSAIEKEYQKLRREIEDDALNELLPEAFAAVREAARRTIGQRHYDVQLIGGIVLHQGRIAEMKTGEGKTLVASLPLYLNALVGDGVHLVTVNDYLARVGGGWMGSIYHALGMRVAVIAHEYSAIYNPDYIDPQGNPHDQRLLHWETCTRQQAYAADIVYGTNNEFGFDYLRDNMVQRLDQCTQRQLHYAIVDEVDNILIDEARTPLIISGPSNKSSDQYKRFSSIVRNLERSSVTPDQVKKEGIEPDGDYMIDERSKSITLTEQGLAKVEQRLGLPEGESLYDPQHFELTHFLENALKAQYIFHRDQEYMIANGEIVIVDEFTGRAMPGRRWSDGLHQAVEAKEGVAIQNENVTLATITFQNYFRMYHKLAGMTGTALTEAEEFNKIYSLEVVVIPTHRDVVRDDLNDQVYVNENAKFMAVIDEIEREHAEGRPVLVGTTSIDTSERVSKLLAARGIEHTVLNAKYHEREATIVSQAGRLGAVTIATNMAGRGTDILLGGNPDGLTEQILEEMGLTQMTATAEQLAEAREKARAATEAERAKVVALGGMHIIATERHEARRIDNQLRGRAGRQGDPGSSRFFLSLEDELMRRFGRVPQMKGIMEKLSGDEIIPIENRVIDWAIENAQTKVEGFNFDIRKHLVEYDDVVNKQREIIYSDRRAILEGEELRERILDMIDDEIEDAAEEMLAGEDEDLEGFMRSLHAIAPMLDQADPELEKKLRGQEPDKAAEIAQQAVEAAYELEAETLAKQYMTLRGQGVNLVGMSFETGEEFVSYFERRVMLDAIDKEWIDYLTAMEDLRTSIGNMAIAQRDPLVEFKRQGYQMFAELKSNIQRTIVYEFLKRASSWQSALRNIEREEQQRLQTAQAAGGSADATDAERAAATKKAASKAAATQKRVAQKVGRNDACPCGSGKKFKHCHLGREAELAGAAQQSGASKK